MELYQTHVIITSLLLLVLGLSAKVSTSDRCPEGWSLIPWEVKCVKVVEEQKSWSDARGYCNDQGGDLVVINHQKTNEFLKGLKFNGLESYWTGGRYILAQGNKGNETTYQLTWVDFSTQIYPRKNSSLLHHSMRRKLQRGSGGTTHVAGKDCVIFHSVDGGWTSVDCASANYGFICQKPDLWQKKSKIHCDEDWMFYEDEHQMKCVYPSVEKATWTEAKSWCHQSGGNLLIIPNSDINDFATSLTTLIPSSFWIGLKYRKWVNGQTLSDYNAFENKKESGKDCVDFHKDVWNYDSCSLSKHFICEKPGFPGFESLDRCPEGWSLIPWEYKCVKVIEEQKSWSDARGYCNDQGGDLVVINHQETNEFLKGLEFQVNTDSYWTGAHFQSTDQLVWVDDSISVGQVDKPTYESGKECVTLSPNDGRWEGMACNLNKRFICQNPDMWLKQDKVFCDPGWKYDAQSRKCFYKSSTASTWENSIEECKKQNASLLMIRDKDKNEFTSNLIKLSGNSSYWFGLKRKGKKLEWMTGFGWNENEYNGLPKGTKWRHIKGCITFPSGGFQWSSDDCDQEHPYICEKHGFITSQRCPVGWILVGLDFKCVKLVEDQMTWNDARIHCQHLKGDLVVINQKDTDEALKGMDFQRVNGSYWIGGRHGDRANPIIWIDRTTMSKRNLRDSDVSGECVAFPPSSGNFLARDDCDQFKGFICQRPEFWQMLDSTFCERGWKYYKDGNKCIYASRNEFEWERAEGECKKRGGNLLTIPDHQTNYFALSLWTITTLEDNDFDTYYKPYSFQLAWIGLRKSRWVTGESLTYDILDPHRWDHEDHDCGRIYSPYKMIWRTKTCSDDFYYYCEKPGSVNSALTTSSKRCPDGWTLIPEQFSCVRVFTTEMTWRDARTFCQQQEGDLAVLSFGISDGVFRDLTAYSGLYFWARYIDSEVHTREILSMTKTVRIKLNDKNFKLGPENYNYDPANNTGKCYTAKIIGKAWWSQKSCDVRQGFICERPDFWLKLDNVFCESGWKYYKPGNKCFYRSTEKLSWDEAKVECEEMGASLLTISDYATHEFVTSVITLPDYKNYWIGLRGTESRKRWVDGKKLSQNDYSALAPWQDGVSGCGYITGGFVSNILYWLILPDCTDKFYFVCEKADLHQTTTTTTTSTTTSTTTIHQSLITAARTHGINTSSDTDNVYFKPTTTNATTHDVTTNVAKPSTGVSVTQTNVSSDTYNVMKSKTSSDTDESGLSGSALAGIAIGCILLVVIILVIAIVLLRRARGNQRQPVSAVMIPLSE